MPEPAQDLAPDEDIAPARYVTLATSQGLMPGSSRQMKYA